MKLSSIHATHFLGLQAVDLRLHAPLQLICGPNGSGKSSVADAVALALTADLGRVALKKEAPQLIRDGADLAVVQVVDADGDQWQVSINASGRITDTQKGRDPDATLPFVLDAQRMAHLEPTERRAFLFGLAGASMAPADIANRLAAKGCEEKRIERIMPLLRSGFEAAAKEAKSKATEAKGAWRAVTGETYGSTKAVGWRATVPAYDQKAAKFAATQLQQCDSSIEAWTKEVGRLTEQQQRRATQRARLNGLHNHAALIPRLDAKITSDRATLAEGVALLQRTEAASGGAPRVGLVHDLAAALARLLATPPLQQGEDHDEADRALARYIAEYGPITQGSVDQEAAARLPEVKRSVDVARNAVANSERDLAAAQRAKEDAASLSAELDAEQDEPQSLPDAQIQLDQLKRDRVDVQARNASFEAARAAIDAADKKSADAARHHADVEAWDRIGDALSPDGIPAEILADALSPINDRLAQSAADTGWPRIEIASDMTIRTGLHERPYRLLSESERWRADAMLAEAVAHLSRARLLVLDRVDVLDLQGRGELIAWLDVLGSTGEIDTCLAFATLRQPPHGLPESFQVHWIDRGVCGQDQPLREAA